MGLLGQGEGLGPLVTGEGIHLGAHRFVLNHPGLVGVVVGLCGDGQNAAGVHLHHDAHPAGGNVILLHRRGEVVFQIMLDVHIHRELQAVALHRLHVGVVVGGHIVAPGVLGAEHPAVLPGEQAVVLQLQPGHALVVHIGKAQQAGGKIPLRIPALGVLQNQDALPVVLQAGSAHRVGGLLVHPALEQRVVAFALAQLFQHLRLVQLQNLRQCGGRFDHIPVRHLPGHRPDGPAAGGHRQRGSVCVQDIASGRGNHTVPQLLARGPLGIEIVFMDLQIPEPAHQSGKAHGHKKTGRQPGAKLHSPVLGGLRCLFLQKNRPPSLIYMSRRGAVMCFYRRLARCLATRVEQRPKGAARMLKKIAPTA